MIVGVKGNVPCRKIINGLVVILFICKINTFHGQKGATFGLNSFRQINILFVWMSLYNVREFRLSASKTRMKPRITAF